MDIDNKKRLPEAKMIPKLPKNLPNKCSMIDEKIKIVLEEVRIRNAILANIL